MKKKTFPILLVFAMLFAISCESTYEPQPDPKVEPEIESEVKVYFTEFCSHLGLNDIRETIPIINNFLAETFADIECDWDLLMNRDEVFEVLATRLNSLFCNVNAKVLFGVHDGTGQEQAFGVVISVMDKNGTVRELEIDFAVIEHNGVLMQTFAQIEGFSHTKQDAIHVQTNFTQINRVFDFINSFNLDVREIQGGTYISFMPADSTHLKLITNSLKAKPYTLDAWVVGHLNWHPTGITFFVGLANMHNKDYQADWIRTMNRYRLVNEGDFSMAIVFRIPEGTGREWEARFERYSFVNFAEQTHTRHLIR